MKSKILLLEDDYNLSETVCEYFEEEGFDVVCVYDGDEALSKIYEQNFDLILLDVMMPDITGYDVCKQLKANPLTQPIPIIFISAMSEVEDETKGFLLGAVDLKF